MIDLGTLAGLHERQHELHAWCGRCERWRALDLARLVREGQGGRRLPISVRCRGCGEPGTLQVRPPVPGRSSGGWTMPQPGRQPIEVTAPRTLGAQFLELTK